MSPRRTGGGPLPAPSNPEHLAVAIHLFPCGHGDTILIEYGDNRWSLIDCFLPKKDGTRDRFFDFVANRAKIRRLDFIFQTHPDYDHYHGMIDVIQHFTTGGRSVGWYLDTGLNV